MRTLRQKVDVDAPQLLWRHNSAILCLLRCVSACWNIRWSSLHVFYEWRRVQQHVGITNKRIMWVSMGRKLLSSRGYAFSTHFLVKGSRFCVFDRDLLLKGARFRRTFVLRVRVFDACPCSWALSISDEGCVFWAPDLWCKNRWAGKKLRILEWNSCF